ncbi:MAG: C39 family peptidase [Elusimicrobiaceae bacterium]|nr:C39 family peptidase [Elusimicrobiaceae bacterium]
MTASTARACVFNQFHSPAETAQETFSGGIKTVTSGVFRTPFPFDKLVLSANFRTATDGCLLLETQVCVGEKWSNFYKLGLLSGKFKTSFPPQKDEFGRVDTDELVLSVPAQAYRYRLKFYGDAELLLLAASGVRAPFVYNEKAATVLPAQPCAQQILPISQMEQDAAIKRRICSPTCVCMALNALGYMVPLSKVLGAVFDPTANLYGNWVFNVAAAAGFGAEAFFRRFSSLAELADFVTPDSFVLASVTFGKNELPGAPLEKTAGHLVLVRGFEKGNVLVADPAAASADTVLRTYNAKAFANVWLNHKQGAAYVVRRK